MRLLNRTNRRVTLTAVGEALRVAVERGSPRSAWPWGSLKRFRDAPAGCFRLNVVADAATSLLRPVTAAFADADPDVEVDIIASNRIVDVIDAGFDGGTRHGGTVREVMIARRLSADLRWVVAASLISRRAGRYPVVKPDGFVQGVENSGE